MQIHELNNFTGTLGAGAYLAVDDGSDTGKLSTQALLSSTESEISTLDARIDNIVGGVTVDSEVIDARLGDDGVTYGTLGTAVRTQFSDVKADIAYKIRSSKNLLNLDTNIANYYINNANGNLTAYNGWNASDYIPVSSGSTYNFIYYTAGAWSRTPNVYYAFYDASKTFTHGDYTSDVRGYSLVAGASDAYLRVSAAVASMTTRTPMVGLASDMGDVVGSSDASDYIPYAFSLYKDSLKIVTDDLQNDLSSLETAFGKVSSVDILLPSKLYICSGRQITLYAPNFIKARNPNDFVYYWACSLSNKRFDDGIRFEPTDSNIGTYTLQLFVYNRYNAELVKQASVSVEVVAESTLVNKNVIFIGDSLTNYGYYPYEIQHALSNGGVVSLGTRTSTGYYDHIIQTTVSVNHEGRGGWSAVDYVTESSIDGVANAFWNSSTSQFDFSYYMAQQGYSSVDMVFVNLGTNGYSDIDNELSAISEMVTSIRTYNASVPIGIAIVPINNNTQGDYINMQLSVMRKKQLQIFDGRESEYIYIAPIYLNINMYADFDTETVAESTRNPLQVTRQINGVHPSRYGFWKFADVYYSLIQKVLS